MASIESVTLEVNDPSAAQAFYATAFGLGNSVGVREAEDIVLLLGAADVRASKRFYLEHGLEIARSFGSYVEFKSPDSSIKLPLLKHRAVAKDAGVAPEGSGSHRIVINSDAGAFTDPEGFIWDRGETV